MVLVVCFFAAADGDGDGDARFVVAAAVANLACRLLMLFVLQAALNDASPGDTIYIPEGTHYVSLTTAVSGIKNYVLFVDNERVIPLLLLLLLYHIQNYYMNEPGFESLPRIRPPLETDKISFTNVWWNRGSTKKRLFDSETAVTYVAICNP